ncbi:hypothetical protein DFJ77DRAFT_445173 [Powellomyces hirtus]|nr:hypothetical protein DFJ77DRAFT_445173 [Powellomyces hirtus]
MNRIATSKSAMSQTPRLEPPSAKVVECYARAAKLKAEAERQTVGQAGACTDSHVESELQSISALQRTLGSFKDAHGRGELNGKEASGFIIYLEDTFAMILATLERIKACTPMSDNVSQKLERLWGETLATLETALSIANISSVFGGDSSGIYIVVARSLLSYVEFAAKEHELQLLKISWKQACRFARLAGENEELACEIVRRFNGCYAQHSHNLDTWNMGINLQCGIAHWYIGQLLSLIRHASHRLVEAQVPSITSMIKLSSLVLRQGKHVDCPGVLPLRESMDGLIRFLAAFTPVEQLTRMALVKNLLTVPHHNPPSCLTSQLKANLNMEAQLNVMAMLLSHLGFAEAQRCSLFERDFCLFESLLSMLANADATRLIEPNDGQPSSYSELLVGMALFIHTVSASSYEVVEEALYSELLRPRSTLSSLFAFDVLTYIMENGPREIRARWSAGMPEFQRTIAGDEESNVLICCSLAQLVSPEFKREFAMDSSAGADLANDENLLALVKGWASNPAAVISPVDEHFLVTRIWDEISHCLKSAHNSLEAVQYFQVLKLPAECLTALAFHNGRKNKMPLERAHYIAQTLPALFERCDEMVESLARSVHPNEQMWMCLTVVTAFVELASSIVRDTKSDIVRKTLSVLVDHLDNNTIPEYAALDYFSKLSPYGSSGNTKTITQGFRIALENAHWVTVHDALYKIVEYSSTCASGPPKLSAEQRQLVFRFIQHLPYMAD